MSKHFLNGITYGPYSDTGPGFIVVDPLARIVTGPFPPFDALSLGGGGWDITISGLVYASGRAIFFATAGAGVPTSNIKIKAGGEVFGGNYGILANHATNITNAGAISAKNNSYGISEPNDGDFAIKNLKTGVIEGGFAAINISGFGTHTITNAGTIAVYNNFNAIVGGGGVEKVTNWGAIDGPGGGGSVALGDGSDIFTNFKKIGSVIKHGTVTGSIDLGAGDDVFNGGKHAEKVSDAAGTDTYKLGGGNDTFRATSSAPSGDGADVVNGGSGFDTYNASALNNGFVVVNLDSVLHSGVDPHSVKLAAGGSIVGIDTVSGFEKFIGTSGFDVFWGSSHADIFEGGAAQDTIIGLGGADILTGGADGDSFLYTSLKDSGPTKATRDFISDFLFGDDLIDLQSLNTNNDFHFLGNNVAFDGTNGAIIATDGSDEKTVLRLDVNGDKIADFSIGFSELITFSASDFQL